MRTTNDDHTLLDPDPRIERRRVTGATDFPAVHAARALAELGIGTDAAHVGSR